MWTRRLGLALVAAVVLLALAAAVAPHFFPRGSRIGGEAAAIAAAAVFVGSYLALAIGRIPGLSIDRAGIALVRRRALMVGRQAR